MEPGPVPESGPGGGPGCSGVDPRGDPFLRTRYAIPPRPVTFLRRERLTRHLDRALTTPLTIVNGAAGAGKTLLVADWAAGLGRPVAWFTTDAEELRPGVFWAYVLQALRAAGVPVPAAVGSPADPGRVDEALLNRLAAELSGPMTAGRPAILVLDEFDRVAAPDTAAQLDFVLRHAGPGLRLVVASRTEPLLPLHRYRAAGELTEIRDAELAFTAREAGELLGRHGLSLPAAVTDALVDRTRGWAAGLRLCALAARESPDPETYLKEFEAGQSTVADFLLAEVLDIQPPGTQDLLLRVSVLERFCPGLANALTGRSDAGAVLASLHHRNAFVQHLGHSWYRLHPLFGEILRAHLEVRRPGLAPELHRRAARWLKAAGFLPETLVHGAAAGDWEFAADALVGDLAVGQLFTGLRSAGLGDLFSRMPSGATGPAPELVRAARDLARGDLERGPVHLERAGKLLAGDAGDVLGREGGESPEGDREAALLCWALLEVFAARLTGAPARAERAVRLAGELRGAVPVGLLDRHPELTALLLAHLGSTRLWAGRFEDARTVLTAAVAGPGGASTALPREDALAQLALIDQLNGWPGRAEHKASQALAETARYSLPGPPGTGLERLVLAAVAVDRDELDRARELLDEAATPAPAAHAPHAPADPADPCVPADPVARAARAVVTARLLLARGKPHAALRAADGTTRPDGTAALAAAEASSPWLRGHAALATAAAHLAGGRPDAAAEALREVPLDQPACVVEAARMQLAAGRPKAAAGLLDALRCASRTGPGVSVRAALVRAWSGHLAGDPATAHRWLAVALRGARHEHLRRPFVEAGPWIGPLLDTDPLRGLAAGWLVTGSADVPPPGAEEPVKELLEELSGRERDVLRRLARMMTTEEIAADLYVSVNTVKTHLRNIYRKLDVNRRADAVRRARALRLL
ncbi:LuxR C-terminal-related transcriptional regulator [Streptomyces hirsutus]|uniref:LuxR C-terminal-related transcriptional regulator n=1 Tax=Streptomyces hirsutus TaxID=35620 RepID=UPI0006E165F0|nr:LuxR C-terminal-related transcriptional regulator [Streptomyces hirsutus]